MATVFAGELRETRRVRSQQGLREADDVEDGKAHGWDLSIQEVESKHECSRLKLVSGDMNHSSSEAFSCSSGSVSSEMVG